ncbi:MAG: hypothetical protein HQL95_12960, partial [Magnetococcales bacterium]|nr:hypothetical protein [Magnetococcales bacterium]
TWQEALQSEELLQCVYLTAIEPARKALQLAGVDSGRVIMVAELMQIFQIPP